MLQLAWKTGRFLGQVRAQSKRFANDESLFESFFLLDPLGMDNVGYLAYDCGQKQGRTGGHKRPEVAVGLVIQEPNERQTNLKRKMCPLHQV